MLGDGVPVQCYLRREVRDLVLGWILRQWRGARFNCVESDLLTSKLTFLM